jgi:drug/metabolite transporter (DMT)-like permease
VIAVIATSRQACFRLKLNLPPFSPKASTGILLMLTALSCFTVLDTIAKKLTQTNPVMMVVWARYFFHVLLMALVLGPSWGWRLVKTKRPKLQIVRGLALCLSSIFFFTSLSMMPLADASAITMTAPILLSALAVWLLKEKAPPGTWLALGLSMTGVLMIIRPGTEVFSWTMVLPLMTAICFACYQLTTKQLSASDAGTTTLFLGGLSAAVVLSLAVPFFWKWPDRWIDVLGFVAMGAIGSFGHSLLISAYRHASATRLAPFIYMQIVLALLVGWVVFGSFPDHFALLGMTIVTLSGVLLALFRRRQAQG